MSSEGDSVGDIATFVCDSGFELVGDGTATCTLTSPTSAEFLPPAPKCRRKSYDTISVKSVC